MEQQGYNTWKACVYEHFVRAGEILISEKLGDKEGTEKLKKEYEQERQFKYIPVIIVQLRMYDKGELMTYIEAVEMAMQELMKQ